MSFFAGVIAEGAELDQATGLRFRRAVAAMARELPWQPAMQEGKRHLFAQGGFNDMWQGPGLASLPGFHAVGTGIQWREIPGESALCHLFRAFARKGEGPGDFFDRFSFASMEGKSGKAVVATDPLGVELVFHARHSGAVVFSNRQIFLREFLGADARPDWHGVMQYLLIGHHIGDRTLFENVKVLPPGCALAIDDGRVEVSRYARFDDVPAHHGIACDAAAEFLISRLREKAERYAAFSPHPFAVFLSGGFDSRLILSALAPTGRVAVTYTTQQNIRFRDRLISEKKIARKFAAALGVGNRYTAPVAGASERRTRTMDYTSWLNGWSFAMADRVPCGRYVLAEGMMSSTMLLHESVEHKDRECLRRNDREGYINRAHARSLGGFNYYTPGMEEWGRILAPGFIGSFARVLRDDIAEQVYDTPCEDFVAPYIIKNRIRRGCGTLPRLIFGSRGDVITPFCDRVYCGMLLSFARDFNYTTTLGRELLRKAAGHLPPIPDTHTDDHAAIEPYLVDSIPHETGWDRVRCYLSSLFRGGDGEMPRDFCADPPRAFSAVLAPEMKEALEAEDRAFMSRHALCVSRLGILDRFLNGGATERGSCRQSL